MIALLFYLVSSILFSSLATGIGIFTPGLLIVEKLLPKLTPLQKLLIAYCVGLSLFGMQAYVLGWLHLRSLGFVYIGAATVLFFFYRSRFVASLQSIRAEWNMIPLLMRCLFVLGVFVQCLQMAGNGLPLPAGTPLYRTNAYDGVFHLGLIESMKVNFPPQEPSTIGLSVVNYHYWSDLILSDQSRLFNVSASFLFFQWTPIWLSLFTSLALYELIGMLCSKESRSFRLTASVVSFLILLFGADSGWIIPLLVHRTFTFTYPAIDNGPTQFLNMPHVFGKLFFYSVGILFLEWRREKQKPTLFVALALTAVSFGLKIYFGIALALGFFFAFLSEGFMVFLRNRLQVKESFRELLPLFLSGLLFLILVAGIYLPVNRGAGGLSWYPLEWPKLFVNSENFDWTDLNYRIAIAKYLHNNIKLYWYDVVLIVVGLVAIYGTRFVGFLLTRRTAKLFGRDGFIFFYIPAVVFLIIGMTTLQDSGSFNVFNFFAVSMSVMAISLGLLSSQVMAWNKSIGVILVALLLAFALPRSGFEVVSMIQRYQNATDVVTISPQSREAFSYIRGLPQKETLVATSLGDPLEQKSTYIPAFSGKPVYFAGKYLLETHNQPYKETEAKVRLLFEITDFETFVSTARTLGITTIWVDRRSPSSPADLMLLQHESKASFANDDILIYDRRNL